MRGFLGVMLALTLLIGCTGNVTRAVDWTALVAAEGAMVTLAESPSVAAAAATTPKTADENPAARASTVMDRNGISPAAVVCPDGQCPLPVAPFEPSSPPPQPAAIICPGGVCPVRPPAFYYHHRRFGRFHR